MPSQDYFPSVKTPANWKKEEQAGDDWIGSLNKTSTSSWGRQALAALRVLVQSNDATTLPILTSTADESDESDEILSDLLNIQSDRLLDESNPLWHRFQEERKQLHALVFCPPDNIFEQVRSDRALKLEYGPSCGAVWSALNRLCKSGENDDDNNSEPGAQSTYADASASASEGQLPSSPYRLPDNTTAPASTSRRATRQRASATTSYQETDAYVEEILGPPTSSPPLPTSSQPFMSSEESTPSIYRPEDITLQFAHAFLGHVLLHLPLGPEYESSVEFDVRKISHTVSVRPDVTFTSIDDGGLQMVTDRVSRVGRVAILEAKRSLDSIRDGRAEVSDKLFAQMVGEALATRLEGNWAGGRRDSIVVIHVARYFMRFLQVNIPDEYITQLELRSKHQAKDGHYINVCSTRLFDLRDQRHRAHALKNIVGIAALAIQDA